MELIQYVNAIWQKQRVLEEKTGQGFNIFRILRVGELEVAICRVLHDLLNPTGSYGQRSLFLSYWSAQLGWSFTEKELAEAKVFREYAIADGRRIDLLLKIGGAVIPIEVKIYAKDQYNQCADYYAAARSGPFEQKELLYVTRFGSSPTKESLSNVPKTAIRCLSFQHDILQWLESCLQDRRIMKLAAIREVLLQLIDCIRAFTNQMEDELMDEVQQAISVNSDTVRSALIIEQAMQSVRVELVKKLFQIFEARIRLAKLDYHLDYANGDYQNVKRYYTPNAKNKRRFGLYYPYSQIDDHDVWFAIEIDHYLYAGFYVDGVNVEKQSQVDWGKAIPSRESLNMEDSFIHWQYIPKDEDKCPNFADASFEEEYVRLFDDAYFEAFVEECLEMIQVLYGKKRII